MAGVAFINGCAWRGLFYLSEVVCMHNTPYIYRGGFSDEELLCWLKYQVYQLGLYVGAKKEKAALGKRLEENEKIITDTQMIVDQEKFYFPENPILPAGSHQT